MSDRLPCFVRLKSLEVELESDSMIFDEIIRGKVREMVTNLLQKSLHARVDIIMKAGLTFRYWILLNTLFLLHLFSLSIYIMSILFMVNQLPILFDWL